MDKMLNHCWKFFKLLVKFSRKSRFVTFYMFSNKEEMENYSEFKESKFVHFLGIPSTLLSLGAFHDESK